MTPEEVGEAIARFDPVEQLIIEDFPSLGVLQARMQHYADAERELQLARSTAASREEVHRAEKALRRAGVEFQVRTLRVRLGGVADDLESVQLFVSEETKPVMVVPLRVTVVPNGDFTFVGMRERLDSDGYREWHWTETYTVVLDEGIRAVTMERRDHK